MATNWQIGDLIRNRWQVYKILRGGMGIVYVVYDHRREEILAAKTFQDEIFARHPAAAERFEQEALTWMNLDAHENVTEARMVWKLEGKPYLFLEYVSGGDLGRWVGTPRLTEDLPQVLHFAIQFCDGMTHALAKGIKAHRDVKPANCLVTHDRTLKVTDFGLAKALDDVGSAEAEVPDARDPGLELSRTGAAAGTCTYMAPEQFDDAKHVDVRADVYSFGGMLYQMAAGRLPFVGSRWKEFERLHKRQNVPPLYGQAAALNSILERCLAKDPAGRYGGFGEVREGLTEIYERLTGEEAPRKTEGLALRASQLVNKGMSLGVLGRHEEALGYFDRAIEIDAGSEAVWVNKADALRELGRHEESIECCERALALDPDIAEAWLNRGLALLGLGRPEESLKCADRALAINPRAQEGWVGRGVALYDLRRFAEAVECYDRVLASSPDFAEVWINKGNTLNALGRSVEALACFERALELKPKQSKGWSSKGCVLFSLGRYEEALACQNRALEINPREHLAWSNMGNLLLEGGRNEEALGFLERALELNPREPGAWVGMGTVLMRAGRPEEALECYDSALSINPRLAVAWCSKGAVLLELERFEEALEYCERALAINPNEEMAWVNMGGALEALGQVDESLACQDRALSINPRNAVAWTNKGVVLLNSGQPGEALPFFEEAHRLGFPQAAQGIRLCMQLLEEQQ